MAKAIRKWSSYVWSALFALVEIGIALMVLTVGEGKFQHVAIALLVLIYAQTRIIAYGLDENFAEMERANQARLVLLAKTLRTSYEIVDDELTSAVSIYKEKRQVDWIGFTGPLIVFLASVYRLVTAVF
jgi:hypothetical protein